MNSFKSQVDWWYYLIVIMSAAVVIATLLPSVASAQLSPITAFCLLLITLVTPFWLLLSTYYLVSNEILHVKSGPFSWRTPLNEIHSAEPTHSPISSPALSLDRFAIRYGNGKKLLVSPADKKGFLEAIGQSGKGF